MPRLINLTDQKNLWGSTTVQGLEPQRSDLWLVDMSEIVKGLNAQGIFEALGLKSVPAFFTQFVQSVTIPELRTKTEVIRRNSTPFNMPSWDEPLDAIKIVFLMDTTSNTNGSLVLSLLQAWKALVRAGRGLQDGLFPSVNGEISTEPFVLNSAFRYDYTFPLRIKLLRGSTPENGTLSPEQIALMNQQMIKQSNQKSDVSAATQSLGFLKILHIPPNNVKLLQAESLLRNQQTVSSRTPIKTSELEISADWTFYNVWLGGWKMGDISYADSKLLTVEATLYAEIFDQTYEHQ